MQKEKSVNERIYDLRTDRWYLYILQGKRFRFYKITYKLKNSFSSGLHDGALKIK